MKKKSERIYRRLINDERRAWLAASMESDGCFVLWGKKVRRPNGRMRHSITTYVGFSNDSKELARIFHQRARIGRVRHFQSGTPRKTRYRWESYRDSEIAIFIKEILPFLTVKTMEAKILLDFVSSREEQVSNNYHAPFTKHEISLLRSMDKIRGR